MLGFDYGNMSDYFYNVKDNMNDRMIFFIVKMKIFCKTFKNKDCKILIARRKER